jgi:hypothetical protein
MRNRTVVLIFAVCLIVAGVWAATVACPAPEEDACSSTGNAAMFITLIGGVAGIVVTLLGAALLAAGRLLGRKRN